MYRTCNLIYSSWNKQRVIDSRCIFRLRNNSLYARNKSDKINIKSLGPIKSSLRFVMKDDSTAKVDIDSETIHNTKNGGLSVVTKTCGKSKWTEATILQEALKYQTRTEFHLSSGTAYKAACKMGILDKVCQHMAESINKPWTYEELKEEALKYQTRNEFSKGNHKAYSAINYRGLSDELCSHMPERWTNKGVTELIKQHVSEVY